METPSPLNYTRKFFGDQASDVNDIDLIRSFAKQNNITGDTPVNQIIAQLEEKSLGKLKELNSSSELKTTRRLFGEGGLGIDDNQLALSFAKSQGLSPDTPLADVFKQMEDKSRNKLAESDRTLGGDSVYGLDKFGSAVNYLREQDKDKQSGFNLGDPDIELDLKGVSEFLRPEKTRPNLFEKIGLEVLSLDLFTSDIGREVRRVTSTFGDETGKKSRINTIDRELNNPDAISRFVAEAERFKANPELFNEDEKNKLFKAAKLFEAAELFETNNAFFNIEKTGLGQFLTAMEKSIVAPIAKGVNQILGTAFDAVGIDQDFTDSVLRDLNFTDQALAKTDPESKSAIAGNIAGSVVQTVLTVMSGAGPAAMFALYGTQGAGGNIETYRQLARDQGFDPELAEQAMVGLGGMVIAGGLGALLTGKTIGQLPLVKSFTEGGEKALFKEATRSGMFQGVKGANLFQTGLNAMTAVMKNANTIPQAAKSYLRFAASTGTVEGIEEVSEEALNELLMNAVVEEFETDPLEFAKRLGMSALGGLVGGGAIGPAVKSRARKEVKNASRNILGLSDIAPESVEEAKANLLVLNERESALKDRFGGELPGVIASDVAETRSKLQTVIQGAATPEEVFQVKNSFSRFISPLGDIASDGRLKGTGFQEAAESALTQDEISVAGSQTEAFREFLNRLENSDLPTEVVTNIASRTRLTRMTTAAKRRNAVTIHDVDEKGRKSLHGIYFTNNSTKKSAYDELFHVVVDSADPEVQQSLVDGFNKTYNARAVDYNSEKTRDRIAARVASILSGDEELPAVDNAFTQAVRNFRDGQFTSINLNLAGGSRQNTVTGPTRPVALDELNAGLNEGRYRMVSVPGMEDNTTFQDENGTVYEYLISEDSDGNSAGLVKAVGTMEKLPTIGVPNTRAIAPFVSPAVIIPGQGVAENNNELRREIFQEVRDNKGRSVPESRALVVQQPESRFGRIVPGKSRVENDNQLRADIFREVGERLKKKNLIPTQPVSSGQSLVRVAKDPTQELDLTLAHIQRLSDEGKQIPERLLERINELGRVVGLLPPAQNQGVRIDEGSPIQTPSRQKPVSRSTNSGSVAADEQLVKREGGVPALGPESFDEDRRIELASEAIRLLELRGEPVPQALLDIITVDAEIGDVDPATQQLPGPPRRQLQQPIQGPTTYSEFLEATNRLPEQYAQQLRNKISEQKKEERLLPQSTAQKTTSPVLAELDPAIAKNIPAELIPAVEALITGKAIKGVEAITEQDESGNEVATLDAVTGFPLMEVSEQAADALALAGVAVNGQVRLGDTPPVDTLPTIVSFNPDALAEVADATAEVENENNVVDGAQEAFNETIVDSDNIEFFALEDEVGEVVRYPTKQAARNSLESQFATESESNPGGSNQDIISIGPREYTLSRDSQSTAEVMQEGFGVRASQVGTLLTTLTDGTNKTELIKAAKKVAKQLKLKAKGSFQFNQSTLDQANSELNAILSNNGFNPTEQQQQAASDTDQETASPISIKLTKGESDEIRAALADGRFEGSQELIDQINNSSGNITLTGAAVDQLKSFADFQSTLVEEDDKQLINIGKKYKKISDKISSATESVEESSVDLSNSEVKLQIRRMRQRIARSRFNRLDNQGLTEYRSSKESAIDSFVEKAQELGGVQVDKRKTNTRDGESEFTVEIKFHPEVANQIFQDHVQKIEVEFNASGLPIDRETEIAVNLFRGNTTEGENLFMNSNDDTNIGSKGPFFSSGVPSHFRSATSDLVKGLKIRSKVMIITASDLLSNAGQTFLIPATPEEHALQRLRNHAELQSNKSPELMSGGAVVNGRDSRGRPFSIMYLEDRSGLDLRSFKILEAYSHEMGHIVEYDLLNRADHDEAYQILSSKHDDFVEKSQDMTVANFLKNQRLPGAAFSVIVNSEAIKNMTMRQMRNDPTLRSDYEYLVSFSEWFADNFARWTVSEKPEAVEQSVGKLFKALGKRLRSLYDRLFNREYFAPDSTFEKWLNDYALRSREIDVNMMNAINNGSHNRAFRIEQEDALPLEMAVSHMSPEEIQARKVNQFEMSINGEIAILRDEIPNWTSLEQAVRIGKSAAGIMPTQELVEKARHYEKLYQASLTMANRPAPTNVPLDVMASFSTSAGPFTERWSQRLDDWYQAYRDSTFNNIRRRLLSPVITRMQIVADNNPELRSVQELMDKVFASAARSSSDLPYVDRVQQEITLRTQAVSEVINPIFEAFGFTNTGIQKALVGVARGKDLNDVVKQVFLGIRNKKWVEDNLDDKYNGVRLETIIDNMRVEMDKLRDYAVEKGLLTEDEFITYVDEGREHYVPRIYDAETVRSNFDHFKVHVVERNLRRVYTKEAFIEFLEQTNPARIEFLSDEQLNDIEVPTDFELSAEHKQNIISISEQIAANIAFGRTASFAKQFDSGSFNGHESFQDILESYGTRIPDRMKRRKLFFIPDAELLGRVDVNGRRINYLESNIVNVMGRSIEQIVKRGEYKQMFSNGRSFADAYEDLRSKQRTAQTQGDTILSNRLEHDMDAVNALYESVAEIVDLDGHKSVQNGPVRDLLSIFARASTMSVMGLSTILAIVETGNIPLRVGLAPGLKAVLGKGLEIGFKKIVAWPGAAIGKGKNYTDKLEHELTVMGYLHSVGEDFAARVRTENPFDSDARGSNPIGSGTFDEKGTAPGEVFAKVARNIASGFEFAEDIFYRVTLLESMTRLSQVVAAHAANDLILDIIDTSNKGPLNSAQNRELKRLGFVDDDGKLDMNAFNEYKSFHAGLQSARARGKDAIEAFAKANEKMFKNVHFRVTTRLINQMIARPNVVTRPRWGNSKHPLKRMVYRLRSFTHGYRELAARFYTHEFRNVADEEGAWGIARMLARFMPLLFMAMLSVVSRAELQAFLHDSMGNHTQADRIRTIQKNKTAIDFMVESIDKTGMTLQASEVIGGVKGLQYGNSIFSVIGGVTASKFEKLADSSMQTAISGDPAFLWNDMIDFGPGANAGVWDGLKLDIERSNSKNKSDADYFGMLNGSDASWW